MGDGAQHGSKLFHTIVIVGAAFGAACGGATETPRPSPSGEAPDGALSDPSMEASDDAPSDGPRNIVGEVGADALADGPAADVSDAGRSDASIDAAIDAPLDAPDGKACSPNGRCGPGASNCCYSGACFPCFV